MLLPWTKKVKLRVFGNTLSKRGAEAMVVSLRRLEFSPEFHVTWLSITNDEVEILGVLLPWTKKIKLCDIGEFLSKRGAEAMVASLRGLEAPPEITVHGRRDMPWTKEVLEVLSPWIKEV